MLSTMVYTIPKMLESPSIQFFLSFGQNACRWVDLAALVGSPLKKTRRSVSVVAERLGRQPKTGRSAFRCPGVEPFAGWAARQEAPWAAKWDVRGGHRQGQRRQKPIRIGCKK